MSICRVETIPVFSSSTFLNFGGKGLFFYSLYFIFLQNNFFSVLACLSVYHFPTYVQLHKKRFFPTSHINCKSSNIFSSSAQDEENFACNMAVLEVQSTEQQGIHTESYLASWTTCTPVWKPNPLLQLVIPLDPTHPSDATQMQPDSHQLIQLQNRGPAPIRYVKIHVNRNGLTSYFKLQTLFFTALPIAQQMHSEFVLSLSQREDVSWIYS